jgi:hypothetical protein
MSDRARCAICARDRRLCLSGIVLSIRGAQRQGYDEQYMAGVLAHAEHMCISARGDWPSTLQRARGLLQGPQLRMLDGALQLEAGSQWNSS